MKIRRLLLAALLLAAGPGRSFAGGVTFTNVTYKVGIGPVSPTTTDINYDGYPDLVCANSGNGTGNTLTVLTNNGSGGFISNATLRVGLNPQSVVVADIGGLEDLVCGNDSSSSLTLFSNNGSGILTSNLTIAVGQNPQCVIAAALNTLGNVQLISANNFVNTLTILTNDGSGRFFTKATLNVGQNPRCVVAANIKTRVVTTKIPNLDLICANANSDTLTVYTNNGGGVLGSNATLAVGGGPAWVIAVDVNNDGYLDLVSANQNDGTLTVLTNNGSGKFGLNATLHVGSQPTSVVAADVNLDGYPDLVCANFGGSTLTVLTNDGSGNFTLSTTLNTGNGPISVAAMDLNLDGDVDLVSANNHDNTLTVLYNTTVPGPPRLGATSITTNGNDITLNIIVTEGVPFYAQWQINGTAIPGASNSYSPGIGQTISYTISNARGFNSGNYQVVVANAVASVESPIFAISAGPTPTTSNNSLATSIDVVSFTTGMTFAGINSASSTGPPVIAGKPAGAFLWYTWQADFPGIISLTTRGSTFDTLVGVYTGDSLLNLQSVAEDDDSGGFFTSLVTFNCVQGTTYQIVVAGYKGETGTVQFGLSPGPAGGLPGPTGGYYIGLPEPVFTEEPSSQVVLAGSTVILSATATNASDTIDYQWSFAGSPVAGATTDQLVITNFSSNNVGNYYLQAANTHGTALSDTVTVELAAPSLNGSTPDTLLVDKFGDAVDLTFVGSTRFRPSDSGGETGGYTLSQSFSTVGATKEEGEPNHAGQPGGASYWYSYTATKNAPLQFNTIGSTFNTILAVYTGPGTSFSTLTNVGAGYTTNYLEGGQPVIVLTNVGAGTRYFIAIDGYLGASGVGHLNIGPSPADFSANAGAVSILNNAPVVAIAAPANNFLTTNSSINVRGTVHAAGGKLPAGTFVQVAVNTNAFGVAGLQAGNWFTNVTLAPGANVITVQSVTVVSSNLEYGSVPVTRTLFYDATPPSPKIKGPVTLLVSGDGKIAGAANQASLEIGKVYTLNAMPAPGNIFVSWNSGTNMAGLSLLSQNAALAFDMTSNLILQATFTNNPFTNVAGSYYGLFSPATGVTEDSSGYFTATLPASGHGAYSAHLMVDGGSYSLSGSFNLAGDAEQAVPRAGKPSLSVSLNLDLYGTNGQMTGTVTEIASGGWASDLVANRGADTLPSAEYTMLIPPDTANVTALPPGGSPGGDGYALITNHAGMARITGALADGTALSQSVPVSDGGYVPIYANLYSSKGLLLGWINLDLTNTSAVAFSSLTWIAPARATGLADDRSGFTNVLLTNQILLSAWTNPPGNITSLHNLSLHGTVNDGSALTSIPVTTSIEGGVGKVTGAAVTGTINVKTGAVKVTVGHGATQVTGYGAILLNDLTNSGGYYLTKTNGQALQVTP